MNDHPWGRIADDGTVFVRLPDGGEHKVGQWAAGDPAAGIAYYQRRYLDLLVEADLSLKRIAGGQATPDQTAAVATRLRAAVSDPSCVGDLAALGKQADELDQAALKRRTTMAGEKALAKANAAKGRQRIADEAKSLATSTQWKATGQRFRELLDEWKRLPRFDKAAEQEQWERFSKSRTAFDKARKAHFIQLDEQRAEGARVKEDLIGRARALSSSKDWGPTSRAYRELMEEWKASPRAPRDRDNKLWAEFRAAQDVFFDARNEVDAERNAGELVNLEKKEALVGEAEAILPVKDHRAARKSLRTILGRWETIGFVPRNKRPALEKRLRAVETKINASERDHWKRSDPAGRARAEATVSSFTQAVAKLEKQRDAAIAAGDDKKATDLSAAISSKQPLLAAAQSALDEYVE
jgi:hypothetical protein